MKTIVVTPDELQELVSQTVSRTMRESLPEVLRTANKPAWLNPTDIEKEFGITRRTQQYLRDTERLAFRKVGKRILVHREELRHYLDSVRIGGDR